MSGKLPAIALVLISLTGLGVGGVEGKGSKESRTTLPIGFFGRWGEGSVEREMWFPRGDSARLLCRISRLQTILESQRSAANITWLKDDLPLDNKRAFITPKGHLNITKLVRRRGRASPETDEGVYRCLLVLTKGVKFMVSAPPITLHVAELGRPVLVSGTNVSARVGSSLRLNCSVYSQPAAILQWQKSQGDLPQDVRITQPTSGVLQITNLEKSDGGIYRCSARNERLNKTRLSENILVSVKDTATTSPFIPPSFLFPATNYTFKVVEGQRATLECLAAGIPLPTITWQRKVAFAGDEDPWQVVTETPNKVSFSGLGNLHIDYASRRDAGRYVCTATSQEPTTGKLASISQEMRLVVVIAPIIVNFPRNVTTLIAKTVRLNCSLHDLHSSTFAQHGSHSVYFPAPRIAWYKDGLPLRMDTRIELKNENQLVFVNSVTRDTGVYQCLVTNEAGYATAWSRLLVNSSQDHPQPPRDLQCTLLSPTSVLLKWSADDSSQSQIIAYSIHFTELGNNPTELQVVSQTTSHIYKNLKPNTNYSFLVRAYSTTLASDPSETVYFTTGEDVPIAVPEFTLEALSPSTLLVSWSPLPAEKARGTIEGYKIQWQQRRKEYYNLDEVEPHVSKHVLTGLHPGKTYKTRVLARTKAGYNEGVDWPWKSITMPEVDAAIGNIVPLAPLMQVKLQDTPNNEGRHLGIEVTWQRSAQDTASLDGFSLRYRRENEPWSEEIYLPPTTDSYLISGLGNSKEPGWYKIKLLGYNNEGEGTPAVELFHTQGHGRNSSQGTGHEVSQMPTIEKVRLTPESQTIVHLSWEVSQMSHKSVVFYTIKQEQVVNNGNPQPILSRSTTKSIAIDGLIPFSTYEFSVRAHISENEFGPYSIPVQTSTMSTVPMPPTEVNYKPKDASTVELQWEAIHTLSGTPTKYQIIYTLNKTLPVAQWIQKEVDGSVLTSTISGLVSNTEYWFQVRGCKEDTCGSYSDPYPVRIRAIIPDPSDSFKLYLIVGLAVAVTVLLLAAIFTVYILKFRGSNSSTVLTSNANGTVGGNHDEGGRGSHPGSRNGVSDLNGREGDYIPMPNRLHTDLPTTPLDTKGGYNNTRVNGFTTSKCNGVVRGKDSHYGTNASSKREDDFEERQRLFSPSRNGDLVSRVYGGETPAEDENPLSLAPSGGNKSPQTDGGTDTPPSPYSLLPPTNSSSNSAHTSRPTIE